MDKIFSVIGMGLFIFFIGFIIEGMSKATFERHHSPGDGIALFIIICVVIAVINGAMNGIKSYDDDD